MRLREEEISFIRILVDHIMHPNPIIIWGKSLGIGKTDFGLYIAQKALELNLVQHVLTNIKVLVPYPNVHIVRNNYQLDKLLSELKGHKAIVFDEAGIIFSSRRVLSNINMYVFQLVRLARKKHAKLIFITQSLEDLDPNVKRLAIALIQKIDKKTAVIDSKLRDYRDLDITITDIPPTDLKFDTYDTAEFEFLSEEDILKSKYRDKLVRILEDPKTREFVKLLLKHDFSYKRVGEEIGEPAYKVGRQIKRIVRLIFTNLFPELVQEIEPQKPKKKKEEPELDLSDYEPIETLGKIMAFHLKPFINNKKKKQTT